MTKQVDYDKALLDPALVFASPEAVLDRTDLSREQKIGILRRREYDASEVAVAEEEGMVGGQPLILRPVILALEMLTDSVDGEHTGPTKQHAS